MDSSNLGIVTIVGITGDLAKRKLLPALYHLEKDSLLPQDFYIIGTTRSDLKSEVYRRELRKLLKINSPVGERFLNRISVIQADLSQDSGLKNLNQRLQAIEAESGLCLPRLFYLAVPPSAYEDVVASLGSKKVHVCKEGETGQLLIEKPFGTDYKSAQSLARVLTKHFEEKNIYRIDHYLAKETVQNILLFRFRNPLVHDIWNSKFIQHIQISSLESIGIEARSVFYEQTGALRDVVQSHLLQLLALTTMQAPASLDTVDVRAERLKLLKAIKPVSRAVRGQYQGYQEDAKNPKSFVETFAAVEIEIDNPRWRGVPIYLRTGKSMARKLTEITLVYSDPSIENRPDNLLTFSIQPNEGIALNLQAKKPGLSNETQEIVMDYSYDRANNSIKHDAYEKLLLDAMAGDQKLFPSTDEVLESWRIVDDVVKVWSKDGRGLETYRSGAWSTNRSRELLELNGHTWRSKDFDVCSEDG